MSNKSKIAKIAVKRSKMGEAEAIREYINAVVVAEVAAFIEGNEKAALHEAGHAWMAVIQGIPLNCATTEGGVAIVGGIIHPYHGHVSVGGPDYADMAPEELEKHVCIGLGGICAANDGHQADSDLKLAGMLCRTYGVDFDKALEHTLKTIEMDFGMVEKLAKILEEKGWMSGEEVREAVVAILSEELKSGGLE